MIVSRATPRRLSIRRSYGRRIVTMACPCARYTEFDTLYSAIEAKLGNHHPTAMAERIVFDALEVVPSYACADDECPSRPAWEDARDEMFTSLVRASSEVIDEMMGSISRMIADGIEDYYKEHPEAAPVA